MIVHGIAAVFLGASLLGAPPDLDLGDAAPDLAVANWVKGDAIDLAKLKGEKIAVVEFWATWCPPCRKSIPHLTKVQKEFADDNVVIVGISSGEELKTVQTFVSEWGKKMDYTVAFDDESKSFEAWMKASGQTGIPTAFIVDKEGRVAWIGHPMAGLDDALKSMVAGDYSIEKERERRKAEQEKQAKMQELGMEFGAHLEAGEFEKATAVGEKIYEVISDDAASLNRFSWMLLTREPAKGHLNDLALKMATRANELTEGKNWGILDTLALAKFETGAADEAVKLEKEAIRLAKEEDVDEEQMQQLEEALKRFSSK